MLTCPKLIFYICNTGLFIIIILILQESLLTGLFSAYIWNSFQTITACGNLEKNATILSKVYPVLPCLMNQTLYGST